MPHATSGWPHRKIDNERIIFILHHYVCMYLMSTVSYNIFGSTHGYVVILESFNVGIKVNILIYIYIYVPHIM